MGSLRVPVWMKDLPLSDGAVECDWGKYCIIGEGDSRALKGERQSSRIRGVVRLGARGGLCFGDGWVDRLGVWIKV